MDKEQLDRIERKLNYLMLVSARHDFWQAFGEKYQGWNAASAYDDLIKQPGNENYLK